MVLKCTVEKELEHTFREVAMRNYGYRKGSLQKATREALNAWISQHSSSLPTVEDPFVLVEGILRHVKGKKTSVELQHEALSLWKR